MLFRGPVRAGRADLAGPGVAGGRPAGAGHDAGGEPAQMGLRAEGGPCVSQSWTVAVVLPLSLQPMRLESLARASSLHCAHVQCAAVNHRLRATVSCPFITVLLKGSCHLDRWARNNTSCVGLEGLRGDLG